ncbi:hypothetical protein CEXT_724441 [Caerostris extrusa]|uniref:Uncharacterized protein n=1 Tax=Caerostris extrusa TaxID=172846 RepID=A0AAV4N580_CAEEX|nr:hypothetical protein CEXT_724441 [Caerostris extrusa]
MTYILDLWFLFGFKALAQSTNTHSSQVVPSIKPTQSRRIKIPPRQDALAEEKPFNYTALAGQLFRKHFYQYSTSSVAPFYANPWPISPLAKSHRGVDWIGSEGIWRTEIQCPIPCRGKKQLQKCNFFLLSFFLACLPF